MSVKTKRRLFPRIADTFDLYLECRELQFIHLELQKQKKVEHKIVPQVVGYHHLPEAGGLLDQPCWTITMFNIFRAGENAGNAKTLK